MDYVQRMGCIQYDTINVVGRNADLVLNARVQNYKPELLASLLYEDRLLWDGFDKVQSIYATTDWPHFSRRREAMNLRVQELEKAGSEEMAARVIQAIKERGPLSSIDIEDDTKLNWTWGTETRAVRASMEVLYSQGVLGVHSKVNTRRIYDLIDKLVPKKILSAPDPHKSIEAYHDWHVLRRIGGLGLAHPGAGERWLGILNGKSKERQAATGRLLANKKVVAVNVDGLPKQTFYMRAVDIPTMEKVKRKSRSKARAAFIAPLDNAMWDRDMLRSIYDFDYTWEVYKPAKIREYGYYVLPVLYGENFVARVDPKFERKTRELWLNNWWWEKGVKPDDAVEAALTECVEAFGRYLGAEAIKLGEKLKRKKGMNWLKAVV